VFGRKKYPFASNFIVACNACCRTDQRKTNDIFKVKRKIKLTLHSVTDISNRMLGTKCRMRALFCLQYVVMPETNIRWPEIVTVEKKCMKESSKWRYAR